MAALTGLGNSAPNLMDGEPTGDRKRDRAISACAKDFYEKFIKGTRIDEGYADAGVRGNSVIVGVEPSYEYERMKVVVLYPSKEMSRLIEGIARGGWGSNVVKRERLYCELTRDCKLRRFVDEWHGKLFKRGNEAL